MEGVYTEPLRTIQQVFESLPEGTLAQLIDNQIIMSPPPTTTHQIVLGRIFSHLQKYVEEKNSGMILISPCDVFLETGNIYQPDIIFIGNAHLHYVKEDGIHGAPDLVIEILSIATRRYDKKDKKDVYEKCGVKEYWIVDPVTRTAEGFILNNDKFTPLESLHATISFKLLPVSIKF